MAKKRVHELAKQYDMPSAEVLKRLAAHGIEVKAAASAVDEDAADRALTGKPPKQQTNGAPQQQRPRPVRPGMPLDQPLDRPRPKRAEGDGPGPEARPGGQQQPQSGGDQQPPSGDGQQRRQRPTRDSLQGERAPGAAGGVRRVVIDSQASRRQGGPGGPGGGPQGPQRRPPRRGGRRRRGTYEEPAPQDTAVLKPDTIRVNSGSTVKDVAEYLGVPVPEVIKKLMQLG